MKSKNIYAIIFGLFVVGSSGTFSYYVNNTGTPEFYRAVKQQQEINDAMLIVEDPDYNPVEETIVFEITYNEMTDSERSTEQQGRPDVTYMDAWVTTKRIGFRTNKSYEDITVKLLQKIKVQTEGSQILDIIGLRVMFRE